MLTCPIPDGPSWECRKTRFSEISQHAMRLMPDIIVFTKEWRHLECHNKDRLCTYEADRSKCRPEYNCLRIQEQKLERQSTDAMGRLEDLSQQCDELQEALQQSLNSVQAVRLVQELIRKAEKDRRTDADGNSRDGE
jgi:cysteinyl-tRNA synthetase